MRNFSFAAAVLAVAAMVSTPQLLADDGKLQADMGAMTAHSVMVGTLELTGAFTRAMPPGARAGGGFVTITNQGDKSDRLVSATSPAAPVVEIHEMKMDGDVMVMRQREYGVLVPAGETVLLAPGGLHIMFMQVPKPFVEGEDIAVTLTFEEAGPVEILLKVAPIGATGMAH